MGACFSKSTTEPQNMTVNTATAMPSPSNVPPAKPIPAISPIEALALIVKNNFLKTLPDDLLYIPLQGSNTQLISEDQPLFALDDKIKELLGMSSASSSRSAYKVLLLLGEAGTGKSLFSQNLARQLWQSYQPDRLIPLFISLPQLNKPIYQAVEETLGNYGLTPEQIHLLKQSRSFIFILDGYDELHQWQNLYMTNQLHEWKAKVVFTCRSQALYQMKDYEKYFTPFKGDVRQSHLLNVLYTAPFSAQQIEAYLQQYSQVYQKPIITREQLSSIPGLNALINNPFLLHLTVEALPDILAHYQSQAAEKSQDITRAALYDVYVEGWFNRQELKLKASGHIEQNHDPKPEFWQFCKNIALAMQQTQTSSFYYNFQQKSQLFSKKHNAAANAQADPWAKFFALDKATELLRSACLLHETHKQQYTFLHASFIEYFVTRDMYEDLVSEKPNNVQEIVPAINSRDIICQRSIVQNKNMVGFLADRVSANPAFAQKLWDYIEQSKQSENYAIAAANAITILNAAGESFTEKDFVNIKIPGADLSNALCDHTNFANANLPEVNFTAAWLQYANFNHTNLSRVNLGEYPALLGYKLGIRGIAYSPDKNKFAVADIRKIEIFDGNNNELLHALPCDDPVYGIAFGKNNCLAAVYTHYIRIWDVNDKTVLQEFALSAKLATGIAYEGDHLACPSANAIHLWNTATNSLEHVFEIDNGAIVNSVAFGPDKLLVAGSAKGGFRLWNIEAKKLVHHFKDDAIMCFLSCIVFGPGNLIASGDNQGNIKLWDYKAKKLTHTLKGTSRSIQIIAFGPNNLLASGGDDHRVYLWDIEKKTQLHVYSGHIKPIKSLAFGPNETLVSGGDDYSVRFWDINQAAHKERFGGHTRPVDNISFGPQYLLASISKGDGSARVWDIHKNKLVHAFTTGYPSCGAFSKNNILALNVRNNSINNSIQLWDMLDKTLIHSLTWKEAENASERHIHCIAFNQNDLLAAGGEDKIIRLWDVKTKTLLAEFQGHKKKIIQVAFGSHNVLASASEDAVCLWNTKSKTRMHVFDEPQSYIQSVAISQNNFLAAITFSQLFLWKANTKEQLHVFELRSSDLHSDSFTSVAFGSQNILAAGSNNGIINLYNIDNFELLISLKGFTGAIQGLDWLKQADGIYLAAGSYDTSVRCWQVIKDKDNIKCVLRWASQPPSLIADGANLQDAIGLSAQNRKLFEQRGAITAPNQVEISHEALAAPSSAALIASHGLFQNVVNSSQDEISNSQQVARPPVSL